MLKQRPGSPEAPSRWFPGSGGLARGRPRAPWPCLLAEWPQHLTSWEDRPGSSVSLPLRAHPSASHTSSPLLGHWPNVPLEPLGSPMATGRREPPPPCEQQATLGCTPRCGFWVTPEAPPTSSWPSNCLDLVPVGHWAAQTRAPLIHQCCSPGFPP